MRGSVYLPFAYIERSFVLSTMTSVVLFIVDKILDALNFEGCTNPHFRDNGMGKIGTTGFVLGAVGGIHLGVALMCLVTYPWVPEPLVATVLIVRSWSIYMALLCLFHFLEFFVTAVRQSNSLSFSSFVITHGRSYTVAAGTHY